MRRMRQTRNNRVTPRDNGKEGLSISGNADFGNGLGLGIENGRNGTTGSLTILGSQQGTVGQNGNYEANANFLAEINGQDIADLAKTIKERQEAEENERNPAKNAKDAKDAPTKQPEEGSQGLVDVLFAGTAALVSAGAAFLAGGGSSSSAANGNAGSAGGQSSAGNGANPTVARKPEDEKDGKVKGEGDTKDEPPKKQPTKEELANFKDNIFLNTTKAATDDYLDKLDKQGVDTKEMRAHAEAQRAAGVRDLTPSEIQAKREKAAIAAFNRDGFFLDSNTGNFYVKQPDGGTKLFTKDEDGKEIIIVKDKDGKIKDRREYGVDVTDDIDLAKKPRQEAKIELVKDVNKDNHPLPAYPLSKEYTIITQVYGKADREIDGKPSGLECKASRAMHIFKSLGLIDPTMDRETFELKHTTLFDIKNAADRINAKNKIIPGRVKDYQNLKQEQTKYSGEPKIDKKYNYFLRGIADKDTYATTGAVDYGVKQKDGEKSDIVSIANTLKESSYAKSNGLDKYDFKPINFKDFKEAKAYAEKTGATVNFSYVVKDDKSNYAVHYSSFIVPDKNQKVDFKQTTGLEKDYKIKTENIKAGDVIVKDPLYGEYKGFVKSLSGGSGDLLDDNYPEKIRKDYWAVVPVSKK